VSAQTHTNTHKYANVVQVMGWGFFIFQSWIPLYLASLGVTSAKSTGLLAGMPWLAAGLVGAVASNLADGYVKSA